MIAMDTNDANHTHTLSLYLPPVIFSLRSGRPEFREKLKQKLEETGGLHCQEVSRVSSAGRGKAKPKSRSGAPHGTGATAGMAATKHQGNVRISSDAGSRQISTDSPRAVRSSSDVSGESG